MQFKLISPKKSKGETEYKTEVKVAIKEKNNAYVNLYLLGMGLDPSHPDKENDRAIYYTYNGDWMNKDKKEKFGYE